MTVTTAPVLTNGFAREVPELALPWKAEAVAEPRLLILNEPLARDLDLDPDWLRSADGLRFLVGNLVPDGATPVAQGYAGHQFGSYSPRLGDGRALLLGETGDRDLHLKGSGRTPFARGGDGLAAVGPMLREYVISEAMHALGVPTTRSLAVIATGETVYREVTLPGAVLTRVAASHLRVGSFQYARALSPDALRHLADHAIARHYPEAAHAERPYLALYEAVVSAQARLVAQWMLVGFIHGVMNTDNMTISGETIDYGPCAFLDAYDPRTVYSSIDEGGRYAYGNQPAVAQWNLARLAEALLPLVHDDQEQAVADVTTVLDTFPAQYLEVWNAGMSAKLGVADAPRELIEDLLRLLADNHVDYTTFFRTRDRALFLDLDGIDDWLGRWRALNPDVAAASEINPVYIPRNHLVEEALTAATDGDLDPIERLLVAVTDPFLERPGLERYAEPAPGDFGATYQTFCGT